MIETRILKSRMKRKFHVRFGSGGGVSDGPTDHNLGSLMIETAILAIIFYFFETSLFDGLSGCFGALLIDSTSERSKVVSFHDAGSFNDSK